MHPLTCMCMYQSQVLADFARMRECVKAQLQEAHVLALRLYTTAAYKSLNAPLRDMERTEAHPFPVTVFFLADAIKRLRAVHTGGGEDGGDSGDAHRPMDLWRGMRTVQSHDSRRTAPSAFGARRPARVTAACACLCYTGNVAASEEFEKLGGCELAPMSTTSNPSVAVAYGQSEQSLLFKILSKSFMTRGADITFLSAFPGEREYLFPPLTYLSPTGRREQIHLTIAGRKVEFTVVEVEPQM